MSDYDMSIHHNRDAAAWAKFFIQTKREACWTLEDIDEELMMGWFANAMMAMHDTSIDGRASPEVKPTGERPSDAMLRTHAWTETSDPMTAKCSACGVLQGDPAEYQKCAPVPSTKEGAPRPAETVCAMDGLTLAQHRAQGLVGDEDGHGPWAAPPKTFHPAGQCGATGGCIECWPPRGSGRKGET